MGGRGDPHKNRHTADDDMSVRAGRVSREATGNASGCTCCAGGGGFTADWARAAAHWSADKEGTNAPGPRYGSISTSTVRPDAQTPRTARFMSRPHAAFGDIDLYSSSFFKQPAGAGRARCA